MSQMAEDTMSQFEMVRERADGSVRENGRTLVRFSGRPAVVDLGRTCRTLSLEARRAYLRSGEVAEQGPPYWRSTVIRKKAFGDAA